MPEPSILDARLAEIDRRLRMIQSGLEPVRDDDRRAPREPELEFEPSPPPLTVLRPAPAAPPPLPLSAPPAGSDEVAALAARVRELTLAQERVLAATQDLLAEHADMLARVAPMVEVSAGPFSDTTALQQFRRALAKLPHVREATVREYAGSERAVLDVHLWAPTS
jgi:hypothetical protein